MADAPQFESVEQAIRHLVASDPNWAVEEAEIRGVRHRVFSQMANHLGELFAFGAMHGDAPFLVFEGQRLSFAETYARSCRLAQGLVGELGVKKGDRVALAMRNYPEFIIAYQAAILAGGVVTPLNAWWTTPELEFAFEDSGAGVVIADHARLDRIAPFADRLGLRAVSVRGAHEAAETTLETLEAAASGDGPPEVSMTLEDPATLMYTSGSTGYPKGVLSSHRGVLSTVKSWLLLLAGSLAVPDPRYPAPPADKQMGVLLALPLFHVTATHSLYMISLVIGRKIVMVRKWEVDEALRLIEAEAITHFVGVPTMTWELAEACAKTDRDISSLIDISSGGAKRPPHHVARQRRLVSHAAAASGYGLTETNALGSVINRADYEARPDAAGKVVPPVTDVKIVDEAGQALPPGEIGEICIRTPANMIEYWNRPDDTAAVFDDEGFLRSGDLGWFDEDGFLYVQGRVKDMILRGGENIAALEVEAAFYEHPDVAEIAVIGIPDERLGETVGAVVVPRAGAGLDEAALRAFAVDRMAAFKIPETFWMRESPLPRGGTEKIDKLAVRAEYLGE